MTCDCHLHEHQVCDICQGVVRQADPMASGSDGIVPEGALQAGDGRETELLIDNLAGLVRKLARRLQRQQDQSGIAEAARDFLARKGLNGSILRGQIEERSDTDSAEQPGDIFWATWNDCNGVFDVYRTRELARKAVGGLEDEFMSVVPVWVKVAPEKDHFYCHWHEDDRDQWRSGPRADGPEIIGSVRSSQLEEPHRGDTVSAEQREAGLTQKDPAPIPASKAYCAFCGQGDAEVGMDKLVEGPTVCICEFCVENALLVLNSRKASVNA